LREDSRQITLPLVTLADKTPWFADASKKKRWLVGVSGGADSVALLHLLVAGGFRNLIVCHLDHGLRGRASTADAIFVQRLAGKLELSLESGRIDVAARMKSTGESMETAARTIRRRPSCGTCCEDPTDSEACARPSH
jgi:tRNA(Ile)-lysidine synthase TilS/MesJ